MPTKITISEALNVLYPLLDALESGYWESSQMAVKDRVFDLVTCINTELNELAKLSVSDLDLPYEPITPAFAHSCAKLRCLMENIELWFLRDKTADTLKERLTGAAALLNSCSI